jgi:hypothetical protein
MQAARQKKMNGPSAPPVDGYAAIGADCRQGTWHWGLMVFVWPLSDVNLTVIIWPTLTHGVGSGRVVDAVAQPGG